MVTKITKPQSHTLKQISLNFILILLVISLPLALWGFAYEYSFFKVFNLDCTDYLNYTNYVMASGSDLLLMMFTLIVMTAVMKFFGKGIDVDDKSELIQAWEASTFKDHHTSAKAATTAVALLWLFALNEPYDFFGTRIEGIGNGYLFTFWISTIWFMGAAYLSSATARPWIIIMYLIVSTACFSIGGMDAARLAKNEADKRTNELVKIRDNNFLKITIENGKVIVQARPVLEWDDIYKLLPKKIRSYLM